MSYAPSQPPGYPYQQAPNRTPRLIGLTIALVIGISALLIATVYLLGWKSPPPATPTAIAQITPSATRLATPVSNASPTEVASPTGIALAPTPTTNSTVSAGAEATLKLLDGIEVPKRDLYAIRQRLKLKSTTPIPHTTDKPAGNYQVGHKDSFYVNSISEKRYYTITATIEKVTEHAYWYVQDGQPIDRNALERAATNFNDKIYPNNHTLFGSEWTPGVDNDPRITVLFADIPDVGGYYSSADEYTLAINPFSNEREMIYINTGSGWFDVESTLAHEFQHMIHWNESSNHDVWLNEGMAVLASAVNGYENVGVDFDYMSNPDVQLNAWASTPNESASHYGAAFLFLDFMRAHYGGKDILSDIVSATGSGTDAIDNALTKLGKSERFTDVFEKWVVGNVVDGQGSAARMGLDYPDREVDVSREATVRSYPRQYEGSVSQFSADYIDLRGAGSSSLNVRFTGQPETRVIGTKPHSGFSVWWSNRGDVSNMTLTRAFDLSSIQKATLSFYAWYDIEETFDFAYVEASTDGGATWDSLKGEHTTTDNPNGTNQGNGFTGESKNASDADSDGWVRESIDLSPYAGKDVMLRFEYITDDGYNAQGFAVDDISIPELNYLDDAESEVGGQQPWQGEGFVRIQNSLPQRYYLAALKMKQGDFDLQPVEVGPSGDVSFTIDGLGTKYDNAVLVVAAETTHTLQKADYTVNITANR